jgi:hypothetical protein
MEVCHGVFFRVVFQAGPGRERGNGPKRRLLPLLPSQYYVLSMTNFQIPDACFRTA